MRDIAFMVAMEDQRRHELARHYGMCLCLAFCKDITDLIRAPYIVGLIEKFLIGFIAVAADVLPSFAGEPASLVGILNDGSVVTCEGAE